MGLQVGCERAEISFSRPREGKPEIQRPARLVSSGLSPWLVLSVLSRGLPSRCACVLPALENIPQAGFPLCSMRYVFSDTGIVDRDSSLFATCKARSCCSIPRVLVGLRAGNFTDLSLEQCSACGLFWIGQPQRPACCFCSGKGRWALVSQGFDFDLCLRAVSIEMLVVGVLA